MGCSGGAAPSSALELSLLADPEDQQPLINEALCAPQDQWASGKRWPPRAANAAAATSL